ncbi:LCP family protein [Alkalibacter rhizosphaerae]|uniref:LCP family protein n=1 Tax=Alkalibacter rhizosphaerae TaxID=2815577 RepID=A0A974XPE7_9FIRM|nr:LCP family protein [Alkalibacter rhizosphaerae]QSX09586.1 LCP family protein [Alkalibacter rhizosphaerae]
MSRSLGKKWTVMKRKTVLAVLAVLFVVVAGSMIYFVVDALNYREVLVSERADEQRYENIAGEGEDATDDPADAEDYRQAIGSETNVIHLLFLGIDESKDRTIGIYRSDIMVVARMDLDQNTVKILSIPRDTYVYLPVREEFDRVSSAYAYGSRNNAGPKAAMEAVEGFLEGPALDHYFAIKMDPVPAIVDDLGGLKLDVEVDMVDPDYDVELKKGEQTVDGKQALLYLQWRDTPGGDIDRVFRVQHFLASLYGQLKEKGQIVEAMRIALRYRDGIETDLSTKQLLALAAYMKQLPEGAISYFTLSGRSKTINGKSVWVPDDNEEVLGAFFSDQT